MKIWNCGRPSSRKLLFLKIFPNQKDYNYNFLQLFYNYKYKIIIFQLKKKKLCVLLCCNRRSKYSTDLPIISAFFINHLEFRDAQKVNPMADSVGLEEEWCTLYQLMRSLFQTGLRSSVELSQFKIIVQSSLRSALE